MTYYIILLKMAYGFFLCTVLATCCASLSGRECVGAASCVDGHLFYISTSFVLAMN